MTPENRHAFLCSYATDRMVEFLIEDYKLSEAEAMRTVYESSIYRLLLDSETGLDSQSPAYLYEKLKKEANL